MFLFEVSKFGLHLSSGLATSTQMPVAQTSPKKPGFLPVPKFAPRRLQATVTAADLEKFR